MSVVQDLLGDVSYGMVREVRPSQLQMAEAVEATIADGGVCVVEGPVGCGKTFAYLTPALLAAGKRVVVATAKKGLQDQIKKKDLPFLVTQMRETLGVDFEKRQLTEDKVPLLPGTVLKGKGNYVCQLGARKNNADTEFLTWLMRSQTGEWADYPGRRPQWHTRATAEDCIGRSCEHWAGCVYARAKTEAPVSKVVVVNHHLLGSDMYFGHGKLVGGPFEVLVIDEAHKLAEGIRAAFTLRVTENSALELADALDKLPWTFTSRTDAFATAWQALFGTVPPHVFDRWGKRIDNRSPHLREAPVFGGDPAEALGALTRLEEYTSGLLKEHGITDERGFEGVETEDPEMLSDLARLTALKRRMQGLKKGVQLMQGEVQQREDEGPEDFEQRKLRTLGNTALVGVVEERGMSLQAAPITLGGLARTYFTGVKSVIVTSATLAVNKSFEHLDDVIGVRPTKTMILPPTFDYDMAGFAFVPPDLPTIPYKDPDREEKTAAVQRRRLDYATRLVKLSRGGAFVLATSYDDLNEHASHLARTTPHRVFAQISGKVRREWYLNNYHQREDANPWYGEPQAILDRFLATPDAVLVGAKSFWEGVDVVGEQLRLVILTKLPFPNPSDPLVQARHRPWIEWALERGDSHEDAKWFAWGKVDQVDMLIDLRQGIGRLIRSKLDRGVIAILDTRAIRSKYSDVIKGSIEFRITDQFAKCEKYLPRFVELLKAAKAGR